MYVEVEWRSLRRMLEVEWRWEAYVEWWWRWEAYVGSGGGDGRRMLEVESAMGGVCRLGVAMRGVCGWRGDGRRMLKWRGDGRRMLERTRRCEAYVDWGWPL